MTKVFNPYFVKHFPKLNSENCLSLLLNIYPRARRFPLNKLPRGVFYVSYKHYELHYMQRRMGDNSNIHFSISDLLKDGSHILFIILDLANFLFFFKFSIILIYFIYYFRFGKTIKDEMSILAPLYQCCMIRYSTFLKLVKLYIGPDKLSDIMKNSLTNDAISPILTEPHLYALDRRVIKILKELYICLKNGSTIDEIFIDDSF